MKTTVNLVLESLEYRITPSGSVGYAGLNVRQAHVKQLPSPAQVSDISVSIANNVQIAATGGESVVFAIAVKNAGTINSTVLIQTAEKGLSDLIWWGAKNGSDLASGVGNIKATVMLQPGETAVFTMWGHVAISQGVALNTVTASVLNGVDPTPQNNVATSGIIVVG